MPSTYHLVLLINVQEKEKGVISFLGTKKNVFKTTDLFNELLDICGKQSAYFHKD